MIDVVLTIEVVAPNVSAYLTTRSPWLGGRQNFPSRTVDSSLARFLTRRDLLIPGGTPILRGDLAGERWTDFVMSGPELEPVLSAGNVLTRGGETYEYSLGITDKPRVGDKVAIDVYLLLAQNAGILVEYSNGQFNSRGFPKPLVHLSLDGLGSLCGLTGEQANIRRHKLTLLRECPKWTLDPAETLQNSLDAPDSEMTNVCGLCQHTHRYSIGSE